MYSRVTLLEIDTVRVDMRAAAALFEEEVLPRLREQDGYEGVVVLTTAEGKGMIITPWATQEAAEAAAGFATGELERYMMLFKAPPGREHYEVAFAELPGVLAG
jgi:hypothetical protein